MNKMNELGLSHAQFHLNQTHLSVCKLRHHSEWDITHQDFCF
ncbi:MAG: hypothetical protein OXC44_06275 [Proteobacteria bacterium]|nr:hypothetical protein [Pseudomonadota bacterium]